MSNYVQTTEHGFTIILTDGEEDYRPIITIVGLNGFLVHGYAKLSITKVALMSMLSKCEDWEDMSYALSEYDIQIDINNTSYSF